MNPDMMLAQLAPLREPASIGWWPMAPGWWLILVLAIIGLGLIGRWFWRRYRRAHYRRIALSQLRLLRANEATITDINQLLKAAALRAFPPRTGGGTSWSALASVSPQDLSRFAY